jgi:fatty-acyl-CoA synthase
MTLTHACMTARNDNAPETTAGELLIDRARRTPGRTVLTEAARRGAPPRRWTFEALREDAAVLAVALLSRFEPGERIALWAPACPEAILLRFAAGFAGLVLVMAEPVPEMGEMARVVDLSGSVGLFVMSGGDSRLISRFAALGAPVLREVVDLADRRALFAKRRCIDGLPEVWPDDAALIRYAANRCGVLKPDTFTHRELAESMKAWLDGDTPAQVGGPASTRRVAAVA